MAELTGNERDTDEIYVLIDYNDFLPLQVLESKTLKLGDEFD